MKFRNVIFSFVNLVDLFIQVPPPVIPRLLGKNGGLISQTVGLIFIFLNLNSGIKKSCFSNKH
jgi:hypothetical protein